MTSHSEQAADAPSNVHRGDPPKPSVPRNELPPGPPEAPVIGKVFRLRNDFIGLLRESTSYGDISTVSVNPLTICLVNDPGLNREVLVTHHRTVSRGQTSSRVFRWLMGNGVATSDTADHLAQRRLMQPQFPRRHIENYGQSTTDIAAQQAAAWTGGGWTSSMKCAS